ncbi:MAG TPA: hypothetical protein VF115_04340 [Acidimicrobiia bacterium]
MKRGPTNTDTDLLVAIVGVVVLAIAGVVWFLNSPAPVEVAEAEVVDDDLTAIVNSCGGDLTVDVHEDDGLVLVRVLDHRFRLRFSGNDCQDGVQIPLGVPLGQRNLVDDSSGRQVAVTVWDS